MSSGGAVPARKTSKSFFGKKSSQSADSVASPSLLSNYCGTGSTPPPPPPVAKPVKTNTPSKSKPKAKPEPRPHVISLVGVGSVEKEYFAEKQITELTNWQLKQTTVDKKVNDDLELFKEAHKDARTNNQCHIRRLAACQTVEPKVWESVCDLVIESVKYVMKEPITENEANKIYNEDEVKTLARNRMRVVAREKLPESSRSRKVEELLARCQGVQYEVWEAVRATVGVIETSGFYEKATALLKSCAHVKYEVWEDVRGLLALEAGADIGLVCNVAEACAHVDFDTWENARDTLKIDTSSEAFQIIKVLQSCQRVEFLVWQSMRSLLGFDIAPNDDEITLKGHAGAQAACMGSYENLGKKANGAPVYEKSAGVGDGSLAESVKHFLFRNSEGKWMVTDDENNIAEDRGGIESSAPAEWPAEEGLTWAYYDEGWKDDADMTAAQDEWDPREPEEQLRFMRDVTRTLHSANGVEHYVWGLIEGISNHLIQEAKESEATWLRNKGWHMPEGQDFCSSKVDHEHRKLQPLIIKLCRAAENVEFLVMASIVEIINFDKHIIEEGDTHSHKLSDIIKLFEACADIDYYVWEKIRHLLDIQKEELGQDEEGKEDVTVKAIDKRILYEVLKACKNVDFHVWAEIERFEYFGGKNAAGYDILSEKRTASNVTSLVEDGPDNELKMGAINHGAPIKKVTDLLVAAQYVDLDVYLDAKEKFAETGAKWEQDELIKLLIACKNVKFSVFDDTHDARNTVGKAALTSEHAIAAAEACMAEGMQLEPMHLKERHFDPFYDPTKWAVNADNTWDSHYAASIAQHSTSNNSISTADYKGLMKAPEQVWDQNLVDTHHDWFKFQNDVAMGYITDKKAPRLEEHFRAGCRPGQPSDECFGPMFGGDLSIDEVAEDYNEDDVNYKGDWDGWTALHRAARGNHVDVLKGLITKGAEVDAADPTHGATALHFAAFKAHGTVVDILLKNRADINAKTIQGGNTALHRAAENGNPYVIRMLLRAGIDIHAKNWYGNTALHIAAKKGHNHAVQTLLDFHAEMHCRNAEDKNAIELAADNGHQKIVAILEETFELRVFWLGSLRFVPCVN